MKYPNFRKSTPSPMGSSSGKKGMALLLTLGLLANTNVLFAQELPWGAFQAEESSLEDFSEPFTELDGITSSEENSFQEEEALDTLPAEEESSQIWDSEEVQDDTLFAALEEDTFASQGDAAISEEDSLFSDGDQILYEEAQEEELAASDLGVAATSLDSVSSLKVSLSTKGSYIKLSYSAVKGAKKYKLSYKSDTQSSYTNARTTNTSYTFNNLETGRLYKLRIRAQKGSVVSPYIYRYRYLVTPTLTLTPQEAGFTVSAAASGGAGDIYYDVYYSENADMSDAINTTLTASEDTTGELTIQNLKEEQTYYVKVRVYAIYGGKKYLGKSSSVKKVTTSKSSQEEVFDNSAWLYQSSDGVYYQLGISYCDSPVDETYEKLAIFVPQDYMNATDNGDGTYTCTLNTTATVGNYTALTAPIVMPVNTPGYSAQAALTSYSSVTAYTNEGLIYAHAGCRGRDAGAPAGVTDLKAAVRYLRYTDSEVPGDAESIFTFGMSGGGAQSSLMGTTGDSSLYEPYLTQIGAKTGVSDAVLGSMCWCPITNLDTADMAYEWMMGCTRSSLSDEDQQVSDLLASNYASYINSAGLLDSSGNALTLTASESGIYQAGTYYDLVKSTIATSLENFLKDTTFPYTPSSEGGGPGEGGPGGGGGTPPWATTSMDSAVGSTTYSTIEEYISYLNSDSEWVSYDSETGAVTITSVASFVSLLKKAAKSLGAFDQYDCSQAENTLFGYGDGNGAHFDPYLSSILTSLGSSYASDYANDLARSDSLGTAVSTRLAMYTPLYYLLKTSEGYNTSNVASYWRIRSGITQEDTALCTELNLALALENLGKNVDFATVWGQGHTKAERTGDSDSNFIAWVKECTA